MTHTTECVTNNAVYDKNKGILYSNINKRTFTNIRADNDTLQKIAEHHRRMPHLLCYINNSVV